jgi:choline dehydrogenase
VGENLQDHPNVLVSCASAAPLPRSRYNHGETYSTLSSPLAGAWPDLQLFPILLPVTPSGYVVPPEGLHLVAALMAPDSRGSLRLASADPAVAPVIDPGLLRERADLDRLEAGVNLVRDAGAGPAFTRLGVTELWPGAKTRGRELRAWIRRVVGTYYHPAGTSRMGRDPGEGAVTDPELRVHGVDGLRVADASVFPLIPNAGPHATVLALGERAAALIGAR